MFTKCKRLRISPSSLFFDASFPFWVGCSKFIIFFCMVLIKNDIVNSWISIIYNIKISSKPCRKKLWILDNLSNREVLNNMPFTFVNHDLRKNSSDKVTPKWLIIKTFRYHLSLSLSPQILAWVTPLGRVLKIHDFGMVLHPIMHGLHYWLHLSNSSKFDCIRFAR